MNKGKGKLMRWLAIDFIFLVGPQFVSTGGRKIFPFDGFLDTIYLVPFALAPLFFFLHSSIANFLWKTFTFYAAYLFCRSIIEGGPVFDLDNKDINILLIFNIYLASCHILAFCFRKLCSCCAKIKIPPSS